MKKLSLLVIAMMFIFNACKKDDSPATGSNLYYDYFPVNVGHEVIYDASLITKDGFSGDEDTSYFQVKEIIESVFLDNQGRLTQRIERYRRETTNDPWIISDVWTSNISGTRAEKKEDNITYIKMIFPLATGTNWDGNLLNTLGQEDYEYISLHIPDVINNQPFDSVVTVLQIDDDNFVSKDYKIEKYAYGIGMIYRENIHILKDYTNPSVPGISEQRLYKETIVSWLN